MAHKGKGSTEDNRVGPIVNGAVSQRGEDEECDQDNLQYDPQELPLEAVTDEQ